MAKNPRYWKEDIDSEDELWVCQSCGAELHSDCVGEKCPVCGESTEDDNEDEPKS